MTILLKTKVHFRTGRAGQKELEAGADPKPVVPTGRLPRLTRLMALALKFDAQIRSGTIRDYATLARLGKITRARMTQIMNLTLLAPDIIEAILFLPRVGPNEDTLLLRDLQHITQEPNWTKQRRLWRNLHNRTSS
jgi:hypothetical protein